MMTFEVTMCIATVADAAEITEVVRQAYSKWIALTGREPLPMQIDYADAVLRHCFDLLHLEGRLATPIETRP